MHVRRNDVVAVVAGNHRGQRGRIKKVLLAQARVVIAGVNLRKKHVRPSRDYPQGGRVEVEGTVAAAAVMPWCARCEKPVRLRARVEKDKKARVCVKCGTVYGEAT